MFPSAVRLSCVLGALWIGLGSAEISMAQDCGFRPMPYQVGPAFGNGYGSSYGAYPSNMGYGYGGPMTGQAIGGGYGMNNFYGSQPAFSLPNYAPSPSIYVGASFAQPQPGYQSMQNNGYFEHHHHHHPWHLGHYLLGN